MMTLQVKLLGLIACVSTLQGVLTQQQYVPDHVYEVDGIEFVNSSKRNDTMQVALTQSFFDNIQDNLINQLFQKIENIKLGDVVDANVKVSDIIEFTFNLSDWKISNLNLDNSTKLMRLLDDRSQFSIKNFTGDLSGNYMYVSKPPVLADIGELEMKLNSTSIFLDTSTNFNNEQSMMNVTLNAFELEVDPFLLDIEGINDISNVMSRFITFGTNVIRSRMCSIIKYAGKQRIQPLINSVIGLIPDEIDIPGTELQVEGGISDNFVIKEDQYFLIPLDVSLHNKDKPYAGKNNVSFGVFEDNGYQIQMYLSEYLLQSVIHALYEPDTMLTNITIPEITTTTLDVMYLGKLKKHGFDRGQPCTLELRTWGAEPALNITANKGLHFDGQMALPIKCKKKATDEEYSQVFTILSNRIQFTGLLNITENLTIKIKVSDFDLKVDSTTDSQIGDIGNLKILNAILAIMEPTIKVMTNLIFFGKGISLQWILNLLHLNWIELDKTLTAPQDGYMIFYSTPKFNLDQAAEGFHEAFTSFFSPAVDQPFEVEMDTLNQIGRDFHESQLFSPQEKRTIRNSLAKIVNQVYQENAQNTITYI